MQQVSTFASPALLLFWAESGVTCKTCPRLHRPPCSLGSVEGDMQQMSTFSSSALLFGQSRGRHAKGVHVYIVSLARWAESRVTCNTCPLLHRPPCSLGRVEGDMQHVSTFTSSSMLFGQSRGRHANRVHCYIVCLARWPESRVTLLWSSSGSATQKVVLLCSSSSSGR